MPPYKNEDQQREYQRNWAAKQARKKTIGGVITYEELISREKKIKTIATFEECVAEAKPLFQALRIGKAHRITIAMLCERACCIRWGGRRKTEIERRLTISAFADKVGMHSKTLQNWLSIKRTIYDNLSEKELENGFDFRFAELASRHSSGGKISRIEKYRLFLREGKGASLAASAKSYLRTATVYLQKYGTGHLSKSDMAEMRIHANEIVKIISHSLHN